MSKKAIVRLMQAYGSNLEEKIADLWTVADRDNRQKVEDCWPEVFTKFEEWLQKGEVSQ